MEKKKSQAMKDLLTKNADTVRLPQAGELIEGTIIKISNNALLVDLGPFGTGIVYGRELRENKDMVRELKVGSKISSLVIEPENDDGYVELSLKEANLKTAWQTLKDKKESQEIISAKVIEANRGGLMVNICGILGFLPVSQLSQENYPRVEGGDKNKILNHLNTFINKEIRVKIIGLDQKSEKLIVSEKALDEEKIKQNLKDYKKGDIVEGSVASVVDFGAFVKFSDKLEGLVHISELDWRLLEHPNQVVKEGDKVKCQIVDITDDHVSLSLKALKEDPWKEVPNQFKIGQNIRGQVIKFNPFGAFVEVDKGIYGLSHISEFSKIGQSMKEAVELGKSYQFKILTIEPKAHKMSLALSVNKNK